MISAIIVAAGGSRRMGFDKLEAVLRGKSVLAHTMGAFQQCADVDEIWVVTSPETAPWVPEIAREYGYDKFVDTVAGGSERHLSVWNGLQKLTQAPDRLVAVHDGARPLITPDAISLCGARASECGAASLAHRVVDTLKRSHPGTERVNESVDREDLWAMETPQIFSLDLIRTAYTSIMEKGSVVTDEVSAVQSMGEDVILVENPDSNLKITVPGDLEVAEAILAGRSFEMGTS